jgi:hypothetical protein
VKHKGTLKDKKKLGTQINGKFNGINMVKGEDVVLKHYALKTYGGVDV